MSVMVHQTTIYINCENVIGVDPTEEATKVADFENNYKSSATQVSYVQIEETAFIDDNSYADFKGHVSSWSDVKYTEKSNRYDLYLVVTA